MASVSQTVAPSCDSRGTSTEGESSSSSARFSGSVIGTTTSSNGSPDILVRSQPRSDQDE